MTKRLLLDAEAAEELEVAMDWYEARRANLGLEFLSAVRDAFARIEDNPRAWPLAQGLPDRLRARVRTCLLRRFPIAHGSREPGYWRHRL